MSADLLRRAATLMRQDAQMGRAWIGPWTVEAALAVADWLDAEAMYETSGTADVCLEAVTVARAYLGEAT